MVRSGIRWFFAAFATAALVSCGRLPPSRHRNSIVIAISTTPTSLDPARATTQVCQDIARQQFETLTQVSKGGSIVGGLADTWSAAGSVITFHLRHATFSDGSLVTPAEVKFSLSRACQPAFSAGEIGTYLGDIDGADQCIAGKSESITGIDIIQREGIVKFRLKGPTASFVAKLSNPMCSILKARGKELLGSGPYRKTSVEEGEHYNFEAVAGGAAATELLEFRVVQDTATRLNMARRQLIDVCPLGLGDTATPPVTGYSLVTIPWTGDYPDPENFIASMLDSHSSARKSSFSDPKADELIASARANGSLKSWRAAESLGLTSHWIVPIIHQTEQFLVSPRAQPEWLTPWGLAPVRLVKARLTR